MVSIGRPKVPEEPQVKIGVARQPAYTAEVIPGFVLGCPSKPRLGQRIRHWLFFGCKWKRTGADDG